MPKVKAPTSIQTYKLDVRNAPLIPYRPYISPSPSPQIPPEQHVDDDVAQSAVSKARPIMQNAVWGEADPYRSSLLELAWVVITLLAQEQDCPCRVANDPTLTIPQLIDAAPDKRVQIILNGLNAKNMLFYCSICEDVYFRLLLERDVRQECNNLLNFLGGDNYMFHCDVLRFICALVCVVPTTIPIFMEGRDTDENGRVIAEGRVIDALDKSNIAVLSWQSQRQPTKDHCRAQLYDYHRILSTASAFNRAMEGLKDDDPQECDTRKLNRAVSLNDRTLDIRNGHFAALHVVGLLHLASDFSRNEWFNSLSTILVNKWWECALDQSGSPQQPQGHLRLIRFLYNWYVSGHFKPRHGALVWKILLVPITMQIAQSRNMAILGSVLKKIVLGWRKKGFSDFSAIDAGVREDLRRSWPAITRNPKLSSSNDIYVNCVLKIILRGLLSEDGLAFGDHQDNIKRYIDHVDQVTENSATRITARSRVNVLLSDTPFYYLISPPLPSEKEGAVKKVVVSWKCRGYRGMQRIAQMPISPLSPLLRLDFVIIREDGSIKSLTECSKQDEWENSTEIVWTSDSDLFKGLKASDRIGIWAATGPSFAEQTDTSDPTSSAPQPDPRDPDLKLRMKEMTIDISYVA